MCTHLRQHKEVEVKQIDTELQEEMVSTLCTSKHFSRLRNSYYKLIYFHELDWLELDRIRLLERKIQWTTLCRIVKMRIEAKTAQNLRNWVKEEKTAKQN